LARPGEDVGRSGSVHVLALDVAGLCCALITGGWLALRLEDRTASYEDPDQAYADAVEQIAQQMKSTWRDRTGQKMLLEQWIDVWRELRDVEPTTPAQPLRAHANLLSTILADAVHAGKISRNPAERRNGRRGRVRAKGRRGPAHAMAK
jgi:hypothetical protein